MSGEAPDTGAGAGAGTATEPVAPPMAGGLPDARSIRIAGVVGTELRSCGQSWLLSRRIPFFGKTWDELYDRGVLKGDYPEFELRTAAMILLLVANDIELWAAIRIIDAADLQDLVAPVERAMHGDPQEQRSWSNWVRGSLLANGLRPESFQGDEVPLVLRMLVHLGRAIPADQYVDSACAAKAIRGLPG